MNPSPLLMPRKRQEITLDKPAKRVREPYTTTTGKTPVGPMFKHDCENSDPNEVAVPCCTYLGTVLLTDTFKGVTTSRYADMYYARLERIVLARFSDEGSDYSSGTRDTKPLRIAANMATRRGYELRSF